MNRIESIYAYKKKRFKNKMMRRNDDQSDHAKNTRRQ